MRIYDSIGCATLLLLAACSSNQSDSKPTTSGTVFGNVLVQLFPADSYATVSAQFFDAPLPDEVPLDVAKQQNGCKLLVPRAVSCSPECAATSVCTATNVCTPKPAPKSVGVIHVQGLGATAIDMQPQAPAFAYSGPTLQDVYPPCMEGDSLSVASDSFSISGACITNLVLGGPTPIPVLAGSVVELRWTAPKAPATSRIQVALEISHHGGYKGEIDCDVPDTGSFDIPEPLVTALVNLGRSGYPTVKVARVSSATDAKEPNAKLTMPSQVEREVDTGVISCGAQGSPPCPTGQTCSNTDYICH
ncbi:MAG: hypothetical protein QM756_26110 [Polyangiaceae bacterium]